MRKCAHYFARYTQKTEKTPLKSDKYSKWAYFDTSRWRKIMKFYMGNPDTSKFVSTKFQKNRAMRSAVTLVHSKNIVIRDGNTYFRDELLP